MMRTLFTSILLIIIIGCQSSDPTMKNAIIEDSKKKREEEKNSRKSSGEEQNKTTETVESSKSTNTPTENQNEFPSFEYFDFSNTTFNSSYSDSANHTFSSNESKDQFKIFVPEGNINETTSYLVISTSEGDTILYREFITFELIYGYMLDRIDSDQGVIDHIKERVQLNLSSDSFIVIKEHKSSIINQATKKDFYDYDAYQYCLKYDLPLYQFSLGVENYTFYGYSEENNKAVPVIYCC